MTDPGVIHEWTSSTQRLDHTVAANCCAIVAAAFDQAHNEPDTWLRALTKLTAAAAGPETIASLAVVEPIPGTFAWHTRLYAAAGTERTSLLDTLEHEAHAGFPRDDVASHAGQRGDNPARFSGPRRALIGDTPWRDSAYAAFRKTLGIHDFTRAFLPFTEFGDPRALIIQLDLLQPDAEPRPHHIEIPGALAPPIVSAYRRRFVELAEHRRAILKRLTPAQARIVPYLVEGLSEAEVGREIGRSAHTIHDHTKTIYQTLGVSSRLQLRDIWFARKNEPDLTTDFGI